jgi:uncharacterized protein
MDYQSIIDKYYPSENELRRILLTHSRQVADRCLRIAKAHPELRLDTEFLEEAAMLHDIGIYRCDAPSIQCFGTEPYICHGYIGGQILRQEGWPRLALVCERHTGTGLSRKQIESRGLPLPLDRSYEPEALEEQVVCYADKFYSKTHIDHERTVVETAQSLEKFGAEGVQKFLKWVDMFE